MPQNPPALDADCPRRRTTIANVRREPRPTQCPACGSLKVAPIVYGLPSEELEEEAKRGNVVLGGCLVDEHNPEWACQTCDHSWRRKEDENNPSDSRNKRHPLRPPGTGKVR